MLSLDSDFGLRIFFGPSDFGFQILQMERLPGVAPGHAPWHGAILLLNHNRIESKRAGTCFSPGPCHFNKEQTPLAILRYQPTVSRWFFRCLGAHLLRSP